MTTKYVRGKNLTSPLHIHWRCFLMNEVKTRDISGISDLIFKEVFKNKNLLVGYINKICGVNLKPDEVVSELVETKTWPYAREAIFDVSAKGEDDSGIVYHIDFEAQKVLQTKKFHDRRKFFYAAQLYGRCFEPGDKFDKEAYAREIFFIKDAYNFTGSPIKKIVYYDTYDKQTYNSVEIYEIYIEELKKQNKLNGLNDYGKMILELVEVLVSDKVEEYTNSSNPLTKGVAEVIMSYTEEEIKKLQEQLDRDNVNEINFLLKEEREKALAKGARDNLEATVIKMHSKGLSANEIANLLDLDIDQVEKILKA